MKIETNYNYGYRYNRQPSFKRNLQEHATWGAKYIKKAGKTNFKLFTFPDAKAVFVEIAEKAGKNFGNIKDRIVQILATQGAALTITQILSKDDETKIYPMENKGEGIFEAKNIDTEGNMQYRYIIVDKDNQINLVKDPYSMKQSNINGWSEIYDSNNYEWKATDWLDGKDPRRIVRKPEEPLRGLENLIIEEINIPTLSEEGTFEKAKAHIDKIAEKGFATAIEIMPVENTFSLQWGYDGVDKFAVNEKMGGAKKLKEFIDYAHSKGLNVIMDMVPNHIGPDGNYLRQTGPYAGEEGDWGDLFNYEGENNKYVRDYIVNTALWWVNEFKVDGLRLDMTQRCDSDWLLKQINNEIHEHNPQVFTIAEDARDDNYVVTAYEESPFSHFEQLERIDNAIENIKENKKNKANIYPQPAIRGIEFDSEWDFKLMHAITDQYTENKPLNMEDLDYQIKNSRHKVKFAMSHDEIGNKDGTRLIPKVMAQELDLHNKVQDISGVKRAHTVANLAQRLARICSKINIVNIPEEEFKELAVNAGLDPYKHLSQQAVQRAFDIAKAQHKLAQGTILTVPGPKMYFQGDDNMNLTRFKFFREFSSDKYHRENEPEYIKKIIMEKGYDSLESIARKESILSNDSTNGSSNKEIELFTKDLVELIKSHTALNKGEIIYTYKDYHNKIHTHRLKHGDEEILVIKHFGQHFQNGMYSFANFPDGNWVEIFNSDDKKYGGLDYTNSKRKDKINTSNQNLNLAPNSISILKKIN